MRITNKIMQNNSLANINRNKILQDKLNTQMTTQKKLTKASDDPVVAIRALRLRTNLSEITQYYEKNVPDARSWLEVTEDALLEATDVITDIYAQCNKGASSYTDAASRTAILEQMQSLKEHIYASADADYAGRSLFTGYRTASKATFQTATTQKYEITEQLTRDDLSSITYVNKQDLAGINDSNYTSSTATEQNVESKEIHRIRLAYSNLEDTVPQLTDAAGQPITMTVPDGSGGTQNVTLTPRSVSANGTTLVDPTDPSQGTIDPYRDLGDNDVFFVPETGELLLGKNAYNKLAGMSDNSATAVNEGEFRVTYEKEEWAKEDLNPINYYACSTVKDGNTIKYNPEYLTDGKSVQSIEYDVGFNQSMRVNTTVDEVFDPGLGRDVDELVKALEEMKDIDEVVKTLETVVANDESDDVAKEKLKAAKKAQTLLSDKLGKMFESAQTSMQGYQDKVNVAVANSGTRSARLDMVENRLSTQQTTFDTLASENENVDLTKVAIELGSAELIYEAALMATGKVAQTSLLNYI